MGNDTHSGAAARGRANSAERAPSAAVTGHARNRSNQWLAELITVTARRTVTGAAAVAAVVLAGCSGQGAVKLPSASSPPTAPTFSPRSAAPSSAAAAVTAAYTAYFPASARAEAAASSRARAILALYAAQPYLGHVLSQMMAYRARHEVPWGYLVPHVTEVKVSGAQATVRDCQDASHAALADARTHRLIPHTRGSAHTYLIATLSRGSDGRWRLTSLAHVGVRCEPVSSPS